MIIDLRSFIERERPFWRELDSVIERLETSQASRLDLEQAKRMHYLYERAVSGLARVSTFSSDPEVGRSLEALVARAYSVIHSMDRPAMRLRPLRWFFGTFPRTFRRHIRAFALSVAVTLAGAALGAILLGVDPEAKPVIMPFEHLQGDPRDRVRQEESDNDGQRRLAGMHATFSAALMTNNIRVSLLAMALGLTWGVGTLVVLFYNGVILGAVAFDYVRAGESVFLAGWLLPHGVIEIPAILLAGQAGFVLASALIGRSDPTPLKLRMRQSLRSLVTLIAGVALMLVWAGLVESFLSQYHEPVVPYWLKIAFGCVELVLLTAFLSLSGRRQPDELEE